MMSLCLHLRNIGRLGRIRALREFLDYMKDRDDIWVTTRENIATHFVKHVKA